MDIWLDTTNIQSIQRAVRLGLLAGVTTNPTLIAAAKRPFEDILEDLLHHQEGPVVAQVVAEETKEIVQQGQNLHTFSNRLIIKVPATKNGLEAIYLLSRQGIPTMATVIFSARQVLMAALAGAGYVAPYINRMLNAGDDPWSALNDMTRILQNYRLKTKILGASINSIEQAMKCAEIGIYGITVKEDVFEQLLEDHPLTTQSLQQFQESWRNVQAPALMR